MDRIIENKEALYILMRLSAVAKKALDSLNKGNIYDTIRLLKVVSGFDVNVIKRLEHLPTYAQFKQYHTELLNECKLLGT